MKNQFYNIGNIIKFTLKKDRIKIFIWILTLTIYGIVFIPVFENMLDTSSSSKVMVETMKNPAMVAMVGPVFVEDSYTVGSIFSNYMMVFSGIIAGTMNIFLVSSNTRKDEELGRLELLNSLPVGKLSNLSSSLIIAFFINLILILFTTVGMYFMSDGLYFKGSLIFSIAIYGFGFLFAVITAFFGEIATSNRTVLGLSLFTLLLSYVLRAIGDVSMDILSLISPLGLITKTENFVNDYIWPLGVLAVEIVVILFITILISKNRDLGMGLLPERKGKTTASPLLAGMKSFSLRLTRNGIIVWALVIFIFSAMYGSVFGDLEAYISSSEMIKDLFNADVSLSLTEQFISLLMVIMAMITTIPVLNFLNRVINEEQRGLSEEILTKPVSRNEYLFFYFLISMVMTVLFQLLVAVGFWSVGSMYLDTIPDLETFIISALLYVPAIWVMLGISVFLIGMFPKITWINYLFLGFSFFAVYLGKLLDLPEILSQITPFGNVVKYPLEELKYTSSFIMIGIFIVLTAIGFIGYRKRDLI